MSAWPVCKFSALSSVTSWRLLTTSLLCCHRVPACCSPCGCCVCMARQPHHYTTYSTPQSSRDFSTWRQHGQGCVGLRTERVLIFCCDAPNGSGTAATTSRPSSTCSTPPTMTFFIVWKLTLITFSSHTCLTRLTYHISFEPALTQWLWLIKLNF